MRAWSKGPFSLATKIFAFALFVRVTQPCSAISVPRSDGYASSRILLVSESTLICSANVSGTAEPSLFALDALTGRLKWRASISYVAASTLVSSNAFLLIAKDFLEKRSLDTGNVLWRTRLDVIPEQKTIPRKTIKDYADEVLAKTGLDQVLLRFGVSTRPKTIKSSDIFRGGIPKDYWYTDLVLTGPRILLSRQARGSGGTCFKDWLLFGADDGRLIQGGSGEILGRTRASTLVGSDLGLFNIVDGEVRHLPDFLDSGGRTYWVQAVNYGYREQLALGDVCLFDIYSSIGTELVFFDGRAERIRVMPGPAESKDYQNAWVLLDQHVLRYAECRKYGTVATDSINEHPRIELYDWDGKCIQNSAMAPDKTPSAWSPFRGIHFLARTNNAVLLDLNGHPFSIAIPSLVISDLKSSKGLNNPYAEGGPRLSPNGAIRYDSFGNTNIHEMTVGEMSHDLGAVASDSPTGKLLWSYRERVQVRRVR